MTHHYKQSHEGSLHAIVLLNMSITDLNERLL